MPDDILRGLIDKAREAVEDTTGFVLVVAGAGASMALVEVVRSWLPEQTEGMADEAIAAAMGFALFYFGERIHPRLRSFGFGVFIAGVGAWSSEWISGLLAMLKKKE